MIFYIQPNEGRTGLGRGLLLTLPSPDTDVCHFLLSQFPTTLYSNCLAIFSLETYQNQEIW